MAKQRKNTKNSRTGCLIWLIPLTLGLIVLLANPKALDDLKKFLTSKNSDKTENAAASVPDNTHTGSRDARIAQRDSPDEPDCILPPPDTSDLRAIITKDMREQELKLQEILEKEQRRKNPGVFPEKKDFQARIFFIVYDAEQDQYLLKPVWRTLKNQDTPALTTLEALFAGPSAEELSAGYRTLLPKNLQARRMHIENGIMLIDLSRDFLYNQNLGREGSILQIYQMVNSMTDFPTVQAVRFSIEGQSHATLGGDGIPFNQNFRHNEKPSAR
ncbi:MAG: GerMN domain-containing protein [Spirochaetota bacterium]|nr:GerMN domain-containing protein [Spirochaetota bacterium]